MKPKPANEAAFRATRLPTKERIVYATAGLLGRQGYSATGLKEIVREAEASFGSIYHHFPGGKTELGAEAVRTAGERFVRHLNFITEVNPGASERIEALFTNARQTLRDADFVDACPVSVVALESAGTNEVLRRATADTFESWLRALQPKFTEPGQRESETRPLAIALLALLEGAFLLSRSLRSTEPMEAAFRAALGLMASASGEKADHG